MTVPAVFFLLLSLGLAACSSPPVSTGSAAGEEAGAVDLELD